MTIKIVFEFDGEIMLNDVPVEYSPTRIVEDAIRQLRADIAERDARIVTLESAMRRHQTIAEHLVREPEIDVGRALIMQSDRIAKLTSELDRLRKETGYEQAGWRWRSRANEAEAELARLRAQEPVAWMWNDMIGIPHTHISPTRPTWPDAGASSAMSVAINVRPLYAEPMPAKCAQQKQARAQES